MPTKFIQLDEAAEILGISSDELNEMRSRNEVRGFRDGATWKFKSDDVDQLREKLGGPVSPSAPAEDEPTDEIQFADADAGESALNLGDEASDAGDESVLISERELGGSNVTGASTIIGQSSEPDAGDSDITLADESAVGSDVELIGDSMIQGSDIQLTDGDVKPAAPETPAESPPPAEPEAVADEADDGGSDLSLQFEDLDALELELDEDESPGQQATAAAETPQKPSADAGSELDLIADSGLALDEVSELGLDDNAAEVGESSIDLSEEDDEDLVLGGGGSGSDLTIGAGDSGISLMDPADSGLSLEEQPVTLDLGGSAAGDESLVLGEDDMIALGDDFSGGSAPTELKADDDFLLTPLEEVPEDASESGSQVIALDDGAAGFDQSAATMLQVEGDAGMALLEEDLADAETMVGGPGVTATPVVAGGAQLGPGAVVQPAVPEASYSIWNVLSLFACIAVLCLTGMLVYDVVRQMWSWQGTYPVTSGLMDAIMDVFKK